MAKCPQCKCDTLVLNVSQDSSFKKAVCYCGFNIWMKDLRAFSHISPPQSQS